MIEDDSRHGGAESRRKQADAQQRAAKKRQSKKKKKKKGQFSRGGCVVRILFVLLLILVCYLFLQTSLFRLETIDVKGLSTIQKDEIVTLSGMAVGENIFRVNRTKAEEQIALHALVASVQVRTRPPHTILVEVRERTAAGSFLRDGQYYTIDSDGYVMAKAAEINGSLPLFTGLTLPETISIGMRLNSREVLDMLAIADALHMRFENKKKEITLGEEGIYNIFLDGMEVKLGSAANVPGKLSVLVNLLSTYTAESVQNIEYVDVSAPMKPAVKEKAAEG